MRRIADGTHYSTMTQILHWVTVLLVGSAWLLGEGGPESRVYAAERASGLSLHETLGLLVFLVLAIRVGWRVFDYTPEEPPMPAWMALASRLVHWTLYALLAAVPLTAIVGAWLEGHPVTVIGLGEVGPLFSRSHSLGESISGIHPLLGDVIIWVAGVHAAAALFHHFILRDGVLLSMLPSRRAH
ncbi:MAG: cytochrome b [Rhizobiales bacterium]|nr:cytochrome b [Hyphomicrobiales bacterium]MBN9010393.1 cytochrome b [Hyphomicrobiales bacterium]